MVDELLRPRQNGRHFTDDRFKCTLLNKNVLILLKIWLKFVLKVRINNIPPLVQIIAWRWPCDKPLSEPMMVSLLTHICITRPQWVKDKLAYLHWKWWLISIRAKFEIEHNINKNIQCIFVRTKNLQQHKDWYEYHCQVLINGKK